MEKKEIMEKVQLLSADNPAKFIKIRDAFDGIFGDRVLGSEKAISNLEFKKIRSQFRDIDVPLSWCIDKEDVYYLQKAISYHRNPSSTKRDSHAYEQSSNSIKANKGPNMEQREIMEKVQSLFTDNPAKFIKIRDAFDDVFGKRTLDSERAISKQEFEKIRSQFRNIDVPLSWCVNKEDIYYLQKAVSNHRNPSKNKPDELPSSKQATKPEKKGLFSRFK